MLAPVFKTLIQFGFHGLSLSQQPAQTQLKSKFQAFFDML